MHIRTILTEQTTLWRFQHSWKGRDEQSFVVKGRESRESSYHILGALCFSFAFEKQGIDAPRRWKSTFATTNPDNSLFISTVSNANAGLRIVVPKAGINVAWVENDFNLTGVGIGVTLAEVLSRLKEYANHHPEDAKRLMSIHDAIVSISYSFDCDDAKYDRFVQNVEAIDELISSGIDLGPEGKRLSDCIVAAVRKKEQEGVYGVGRIEDVPTGNYEVWFEGDYRVEAKPNRS